MAEARRVITLLGNPSIAEDGEATEVIEPGMLLEGVTSVSKQTGTGNQPAHVALERDELGKGIDDTAGSASLDPNQVAQQTSAYQVGDTVKVGAFAAGMRFYGFIASGQNIGEDELMDSAGDGTLAGGATSGAAMTKALEAVNATNPGNTHIRVEVV